MGKGKFAKRSTRKTLLWLLLFSLILFCITVYLAYDITKQEEPNIIIQTEPTIAEPDINTEPDINENNDDSTHSDGDNFTQPDSTVVPTEITPTETQAQPSEPSQTEVPETLPPVIIVQQADAEYERWLASALVVGISMEYPDFIPDGIYSVSATSLEDKYSSDGVYVIFETNGSTMAIHSKPISGERTKADTKDISSETIGFATFDFIDPASINVDSMDRIELEDLGELIAQSLLVSIYTH